MVKLACALVVMAVVLWVGMGDSSAWLQYRVTEKLLRLSALVAGGMVTYFAVLFALGFRVQDFKKRMSA